MLMKRIFPLIALIVFLLSACTVTEELTINSDRSGESVSDIHVEQFFIDVLGDFAEFLPENDESIMDSAISGYVDGMTGIASIEKSSWEKTGENEYLISFSYSSLEKLLSDFNADEQTLLTVTDNSISLYLDIESYQELKKIVPFLADPNFEVYAAEYNQGMSEEDYLDMIYFLLGEDGPEAIRNGQVTMDITVPGTITATEGCEAIDSNTIRFSFPIIDFLLLNEPISFSAEWN